MQKDNQYIRIGTFNGQEVEDILIDSGAAVSVLASDLLPTNFKREDRVWLAGFGGSPCLYETSMVDVNLGERQFQLRMVVAEREQLRRSAIIGQNVASRFDAGPGPQGQDTWGHHRDEWKQAKPTGPTQVGGEADIA